jgi:hypothetical protein
MKTISEILASIKVKVSEHKLCAEQVGEELIRRRNNMAAKPSLVEASEVLILKGRQDFHKACILALNDLKNEIEK